MDKEREPQATGRELPREDMQMRKLVLASASPRRAEILRIIGWPFKKLAVEIDETRSSAEDARTYVERLAREKAEAAAKQCASGLVLGADTSVVIDGDILGKPRDEADARRMLQLLSGNWHEVLTGVALVSVGDHARSIVAHERTRVRFAQMSDAEINWYVATGEAIDKAGAYAVQGRAMLFIKEVQGDYWNIVGLPIRLVYELAHDI